jgi:hypothetical protein
MGTLRGGSTVGGLPVLGKSYIPDNYLGKISGNTLIQSLISDDGTTVTVSGDFRIQRGSYGWDDYLTFTNGTVTNYIGLGSTNGEMIFRSPNYQAFYNGAGTVINLKIADNGTITSINNTLDNGSGAATFANDVFIGNQLKFDATSTEKSIKFKYATTKEVGFFTGTSGEFGAYDWQNSRDIWRYASASNSFTITPATTFSGAISVGGNVTASTAPSAGGHLTNKTYVDAQIAIAKTYAP